MLLQTAKICVSVADMGFYQIGYVVAAAAAIFVALVLGAFFAGRLFQDRKIRRRIMMGTIVIYLLVVVGYFGLIAFSLSGNLTSPSN